MAISVNTFRHSKGTSYTKDSASKTGKNFEPQTTIFKQRTVAVFFALVEGL